MNPRNVFQQIRLFIVPLFIVAGLLIPSETPGQATAIPSVTTTITPSVTTTITPSVTTTITPSVTTTITPSVTTTITPSVTTTITPSVTTTVTPDVTPSETPDENDEVVPDNVVIIQILMPNNQSIEGAPYTLFAPGAAQISGGGYHQGVIGAGNIIRHEGLIEGQYRLLVEPAGVDPIDFLFGVGSDPVTQLLAIVYADGTVSVTAGELTEIPSAVPPTSVPGSDASVTELPSTGAGEESNARPMLLFALAAGLMGTAGLAVVRRAALNR